MKQAFTMLLTGWMAISCALTPSARAQTVFPEGQRPENQGVWTYKTGQILMVSGAAMAVSGAGLLWLASRPERTTSNECYRWDTPGVLALVGGYTFVIFGVTSLIEGIPVTFAGRGMMNARDPWRQARYRGEPQRGFGLILESGGSVPFVQGRMTAGYHFNQHFFVGAGTALSYDFDKVHSDYHMPLEMPVFADVRLSIGSRLLAPYAGFSGGYDILDRFPYLAADLGLRIRLSQDNTRSMWTSLMGEVSGSYYRAGLKMGYSF